MSFEEDQDGSFTTYLAEGDKVRVPVRIDLPRTVRVGQNPRTAAFLVKMTDYFSYF